MYGTMEGEIDGSNCVSCFGTVVDKMNGGTDCGMLYWVNIFVPKYLIYQFKVYKSSACKSYNPLTSDFYGDQSSLTHDNLVYV